jgi:hypothetical protein
MALVKIRNDADDGWIVVGGGVEILQQDAEPGSTYPGLLWVDTDADLQMPAYIEDDDQDTKVQCEASGDEDIVRIDAGGSEVAQFQIDGNVQPLQPAFSVYLSTELTDLAAGTNVTLQFDTEIFDNGADFDTETYTFTAPVDGKYILTLNLRLDAVDQTADYYSFWFKTSNNDFYGLFDPGVLGGDPVFWPAKLSIVADMDANDTVYVRFRQQAGANQTDINNAAYYCFTGYLLG